MKYFVTGFHRAGTHAAAEDISARHKAAYIEERHIKWDSLDLALALPDGSCIHCPGLAHHTIELAKHGTVFWVTRGHDKILKSMRTARIDTMAWHIMKGFKNRFPEDPIWDVLTYSDRTDCHRGFVGYFTLLLKVKEYFYNKHFKDIVELVEAEKQPYYDPAKSIAEQISFKAKDTEKIQYHQQKWETAHASLRLDKI